jgi:hypothetical protein
VHATASIRCASTVSIPSLPIEARPHVPIEAGNPFDSFALPDVSLVELIRTHAVALLEHPKGVLQRSGVVSRPSQSMALPSGSIAQEPDGDNPSAGILPTWQQACHWGRAASRTPRTLPILPARGSGYFEQRRRTSGRFGRRHGAGAPRSGCGTPPGSVLHGPRLTVHPSQIPIRKERTVLPRRLKPPGF